MVTRAALGTLISLVWIVTLSILGTPCGYEALGADREIRAPKAIRRHLRATSPTAIFADRRMVK